MARGKRISKIAGEFNVGFNTIVDFLQKNGFNEDFNPNTKVTDDMYSLLEKEYKNDLTIKKQSDKISTVKVKKETVSIDDLSEKDDTILVEEPVVKAPHVVGKIDLDNINKKTPREEVAPKPVEKQAEEPKKVEPQVQEKEKTIKEQPIKEQITKEQPEKKSASEQPAPKPTHADNKPKEQPVKVQQHQQQPKAAAKPVAEVKTPEANVAPQPKPAAEPVAAPAPARSAEPELFSIRAPKKLSGPTVVGKIELPVVADRSDSNKNKNKKKRKRIHKENEKVDVASPKTINQVNNNLNRDRQERKQQSGPATNNGGGQNQNRGGQGQQGGGQNPNRNNNNNNSKLKKRPVQHVEVKEVDVQKQVKDTLARLTAKGSKSKTSKHRRDKRDAASQRQAEEMERIDEEKKILKVTEFVTANELATMMDVPVNKVIATFMSLGTLVSINQRLDAESMSIVAEEFGYKVEFVSVEMADAIEDEEDDEAELEDRSPIITVMGHVDHGKTSLLDYIRNTSVTSDEAGGITQHIGAYSVKLESGRKITFLDTPGHEAFTAMRARGAQVTDVVIIIVAADDSVMPQTIEAINHAQAANVPIVFAINKIDKPGANPDKIREALANMNYLVEEWGGKYQCQEISAKKGLNVDKLLDKVLLEADMLNLKANPNRNASGNVIESSLDKGRGYVATLLVRTGTLHVGDMVLCGSTFGHVKAMFNERNQKVDTAGPSDPVLVLGLNGAPQAGEKFNMFADEKEAKDIANKREQLQREQGIRTKKHITLDEIGRRIAIGNFQEINVIVKGDVDGSIEALSDSLIKLSTEEIQINVIHKAVGAISESDIMLAAASNAIVVGFQVRPSVSARKLAEREEVDVRLYSIVYDAIEELKAAMEGMLSPEIKEQINGNLEVLETFKINKVGTIAGCMVKEGKVKSKSKVRIVRDGIVIFTGQLESLKRFKDDVKEVVAGLDCGLNLTNFNDLQKGDMIEAFEEIEVSRKL